MYVLMVFFHLSSTSTKPNDRYSQNPPLPLFPLPFLFLKALNNMEETNALSVQGTFTK